MNTSLKQCSRNVFDCVLMVLLVTVFVFAAVTVIPALLAGHRASPIAPMEDVISALEAYRARYGDLPRGSTSNIVCSLQGKNPDGLTFLRPDAEPGDQRDGWGGSLKISISSGVARVSSSGADGVWDTTDDVIGTRILK